MVVDTKSKEYFAVKVINRDKLMKRKLDRYKNLYSLIEKEVAILKRMVVMQAGGQSSHRLIECMIEGASKHRAIVRSDRRLRRS